MKTAEKYLWGIVGLGFVLRLGFVLTLKPDFYFGDESLYHTMAVNFLAGLGLNYGGFFQAFRPPLFPLLAAFVHGLGGGLVAVRILNVLLSTLTLYFIYFLGKELFGERVGLGAAGISAVWPFFIFYNGFYLTEPLYLLLTVAFTFYLVCSIKEPSPSNLFLSGLLLGLNLLCRPTLLFLSPFLLLLFVLAQRKIKPVFYIGLFCLLTLSPWIVRNYRILNAFVPGTTMGGRVFYEGNNPYSVGGPCQVFPEDTEKLPEIERDRTYYRLTLQLIWENPARFRWLLMNKFKRLWSLVPNAAGFQAPLYRNISLLAMAPTLPFFIFGFFLSFRFWRTTAFLAIQIIYITIFHMVVLASIRYRLPIEPFYLILAVFGFNSSGGFLTGSGRKR